MRVSILRFLGFAAAALVALAFAGPGRADMAVTPLVSTSWLKQHLNDADVVVLDIRSAIDGGGVEAYVAGHIPGAVHVPEKSLRLSHGDRKLLLEPAADLAKRFGELGVSRDTPVVIYGEDKIQDATLVAVALTTIGHEKLAILAALEKAPPELEPVREALTADAQWSLRGRL